MRDFKRITIGQLLQPWKYCWKDNSYLTMGGDCASCIYRRQLEEKQNQPVFNNPTPRKCRGHKKPFGVENGKCSRCGGKYEKS